MRILGKVFSRWALPVVHGWSACPFRMPGSASATVTGVNKYQEAQTQAVMKNKEEYRGAAVFSYNQEGSRWWCDHGD